MANLIARAQSNIEYANGTPNVRYSYKSLDFYITDKFLYPPPTQKKIMAMSSEGNKSNKPMSDSSFLMSLATKTSKLKQIWQRKTRYRN